MSNYGVNNQIKSNVQVSFDNPLYVSKETNQSKTNNDPIKTLTNTFQPQEVKVNLPNKEVRMDGTGLDIDKQISVANKNHDKQKNAVSNDVLKNLAFDTFDDDGNEIEGMGGENSEGNINDEINADLKDLRNRMGTTGTGGETKARGFTELENELKADLKIFDEIKAPKTEVNTTVTIVQIDKKASLKDVQVATDTVKKDVAPKDEEAKDLGKSGGILKSIKNFFTWVANLFTGKKKEDKGDVEDSSGKTSKTELPKGDKKAPLNEVQTKTLGVIEKRMEKIETRSEEQIRKDVYAKWAPSDRLGPTNFVAMMRGEVSLTTGTTQKEVLRDLTPTLEQRRDNLLAKFMDDMISHHVKNANEKNEEHANVKNFSPIDWKKAILTGFEAVVKREKNTDGINDFLDSVIGHLDRGQNEEISDKRAVIRQGLLDLKATYGDAKAIRERGIKDFNNDLASQIRTPGSFFRNNGIAATSVGALIKFDSSEVPVAIEKKFKEIIREYYSTSQGTESLKLDGSEQNKIAVGLTTRLVNELFGDTPEKQKEFANKYFSPETKQMLREANLAIKNFKAGPNEQAVSEESKNTCLNMWNAQNLILRVTGDVMANVLIDLNKEKPGIGQMAKRMQDVLTQAANNIVKADSKSEREFLQMESYTMLREAMPTILSNVVDQC